MSRRIVAVVIALVAALTLSSCGDDPVAQRDVVASVDGVDLTRDDLDQLLNNRVVQESLQVGAVDGDTATMQQVDGIISVWIVLQAIHGQGVADLDDETTANSVLTQLGGDYQTQFDEATGATRDVIVRFIAFQTQNNAGQLQRDDLVAAVHDADVSVDSRYGYWDPDRASVVPFGTDAPAV